MYLKSIELTGFKSFGKKTELQFGSRIAGIVGPNGSGKCVAGDTLLRRVHGETTEDVRIVDIKTGDTILTLEEATGRIIPSRVNALISMGKKDILEITTVTGNKIRTTDTHPYLALPKDRKPRVGVFVDEANLYWGAKRSGWKADIRALRSILGEAFDVAFFNVYVALPDEKSDPESHAKTMRNLARSKHVDITLKTKPLKYLPGGVKKGNVDIEIALDAARTIDELDGVVILSGGSDFVELWKYAFVERGVSVLFMTYEKVCAYELKQTRYCTFEKLREWVDEGLQNNTPDLAAGRISPLMLAKLRALSSERRGEKHRFVRGGEWTQAQNLSEGQMIAMAEGDMAVYERIVNITRMPAEDVYDIEVAGTHNFVANGIIAHNSNVADGFRFVLGEQSMKSMRGKRGEDMIWGGSPALPRMNRAAVRLVFDNSKRLLDIDFSEVIVERIVHRDGANEYLLNGSQVRLKDVIRLLAGANIGGSGYQIISQGEADRILNASPKERREMVEDALGLKLYQHKKAESERKLEETAVNIDTTKSLRRELAPHLKFLEAQVEKIEKAREMKAELAHKLVDYLARENAWLTAEATRIADDVHERETEIHTLQNKLHGTRSLKGGAQKESPLLTKVHALQNEVGEARRKRELIVRDLGRAEGAVEAAAITVEHVVPAPHVRDFVREITEAIEEAEHVADIAGVKKLLSQLRERIRAFIEGLSGAAPITNEEARKEVIRLSAALEKTEAEESRIAKELEDARGEIAKEREAAFAAEREEVQFEAQLREAQSKMFALKSEREHLSEQKRRFEEEVREGIALLGSSFEGWNNQEVPEGALVEERREQEKRRRDIERYKIKIEEAGVGGGEAIEKEYQQTTERDAFLAKELEDLERSAASLKDLIVELEKTIDERFKDGLKHINEALGGFFEKLFGGGHAKLFVEESKKVRAARGEDFEEGESASWRTEEEEVQAGLSIDVALPRKKIRGLEVLSGGERALTSIALIFSMSQVNPPPFLILDETDAALDEANSKRYADMIMELGKKSQLIVITHNRATMSAAGELYGVTMSQDGVSKILSVKLEEAERVAK